DADDILIVNGIQEGLSLIAQLFVNEGTEVVVEDPCYMGAANMLISRGARLIPVPVDDEGLCVDKLPDDAALAYLTPAHQYPTGAVLSVERRQRLLHWAQSCRTYILEDDYDSDFQYDQAPLPALKSQDACGHVVYMGTFSKSLGAGLRVGYLILPPALFQPALTEQLGGEISGTQGGMHLVWRMPETMPDALEVERRARALGVGVYSFPTGNARLFGASAKQDYARSLMMGYAALQEPEIEEGVARLAALAHADGRVRWAMDQSDSSGMDLELTGH